jgi:selenocysteine lyase/cysteine desulfurase
VVAVQVGLGHAVEYANQLSLEWMWGRIQSLAAHMRTKLRCIPGVVVHDRGRSLCGIVSFTKVCAG